MRPNRAVRIINGASPGSPVGVLLLAAAAAALASSWTNAFAPPVVVGRVSARRRAARAAEATGMTAAESRTLLAAASSESGGGDDDTSKSSSTSSSAVKEDMNPVTRASWFAVEAFGKVFGGGGGDDTKEDTLTADSSVSPDVDLTRAPLSLDEALARIKLDNDRSYFLSGRVDTLAYDEQCTFSDPFVSFSGRDRFVENLANLGSFITEYDARMLNYEVSDDGTTAKTRVMVKLELNLPWRPVLAWPWGVRYSIDGETCLITEHEESWDIEPWEGVKQIFRRPTVRIGGSNKSE